MGRATRCSLLFGRLSVCWYVTKLFNGVLMTQAILGMATPVDRALVAGTALVEIAYGHFLAGTVSVV